MSRACIYLVNVNSFYMLMVANSISMLRQHNRDVPIKVLFISNTSRTIFDQVSNMDRSMFEGLCAKYDAQIISRPHYELPDDPHFFFSNKAYFAEFQEDEILFIDGDTFIFDDVESLFDSYTADFVGCENKWMGNEWNDNTYLDIKPFNGGILLCKNGVHRDLFPQLPQACMDLKQGNTPLAKWIQNGRQHNREEFGTSYLVQKNNIKHDYFKKRDAFNILMLEQMNQIENQSKVFHCYAKQWTEAYKRLFYNARRKATERY